MKAKLFLISCVFNTVLVMKSQTVLFISVDAADDDFEERISGALPQTGTVGDMIAGSTVLELGNETATTDPQLVGLRFTNVTIPKFASIMNAYIQFAVAGTSKKTDPCNLAISAENSVNAPALTNAPFNLSARNTVAGSVNWSVSGDSWNTVGSAGTDQRTPDIKSLIQPIVFQNNWASGNAMAFFIKGSGTREVESYEGNSVLAPQLVITYSTTGTNTVVTGVRELTRASHLKVYPNPCKGEFNVSIDVYEPSSDVVVSIFDVTGKLVEEKTETKLTVGTQHHYKSTSKLIPGLYFVKVKANNKQDIVKIIVE